MHSGRCDTAANANANSDVLGKFANEISLPTLSKSCEFRVAKEFASECESFCEWNGKSVVLAAEIPCERTFATKSASDCECDGLVHSGAKLQKLRLPQVILASPLPV